MNYFLEFIRKQFMIFEMYNIYTYKWGFDFSYLKYIKLLTAFLNPNLKKSPPAF